MDKIKSKIGDDGYIVVKKFFSKTNGEKLESELKELKNRFYNKKNILDHCVYPSDKTETRESHAMMISEGLSDLPKVDHTGFEPISKFLTWHNNTLEALTGKKVAESERALLNWQYYHCSSKPVGEHFQPKKMDSEIDLSIRFQLAVFSIIFLSFFELCKCLRKDHPISSKNRQRMQEIARICKSKKPNLFPLSKLI